MRQALCVKEVFLRVLQGGTRFVLVFSVSDPVWAPPFVKCNNGEKKKDVQNANQTF